MSLGKNILNILYKGKYKNYRFIFDLLVEENSKNKKLAIDTLRTTLSRMKKKGLVNNKEGQWKITDMGLEILNSPRTGFREYFFEKSRTVKAKKSTIVCFDIPEKERRSRDWLRSELIGFGFELIQKSVWFGPPLPKEFITFLEKRKILDYVRFFRADAEDIK